MMATDGPMARRVSDLRLAMDILGGRDPRDPGSVNVPFEGTPADPTVAGIVTSIAVGPFQAVVSPPTISQQHALAVSTLEPPNRFATSMPTFLLRPTLRTATRTRDASPARAPTRQAHAYHPPPPHPPPADTQ